MFARFFMNQTLDGKNQRWRIENVDLSTEDESNGWYVVENFEWRIVEVSTGKIVLKIPYRHVVDNTEYPERDYWVGPRRIEISGNEVRAFLTISDRTGVRFEGQEDVAAGYDVFKLPD